MFEHNGENYCNWCGQPVSRLERLEAVLRQAREAIPPLLEMVPEKYRESLVCEDATAALAAINTALEGKP